MEKPTQVEALKLANEYRATMDPQVLHLWADDARDMIRRLHAENESLRASQQAERAVADGYVLVPVEVRNLYYFMDSAFVPMTSQHEQIAISLKLAKKAMASAPVQQAAPGDAETLGKLFREALAWGMTYGPEIPAHQWDEMRESMVKQYTDRAAIASKQP